MIYSKTPRRTACNNNYRAILLKAQSIKDVLLTTGSFVTSTFVTIPKTPKISLTWSSVTVRVKLVTTTAFPEVSPFTLSEYLAGGLLPDRDIDVDLLLISRVSGWSTLRLELLSRRSIGLRLRERFFEDGDRELRFFPTCVDLPGEALWGRGLIVRLERLDWTTLYAAILLIHAATWFTNSVRVGPDPVVRCSH